MARRDEVQIGDDPPGRPCFAAAALDDDAVDVLASHRRSDLRQARLSLAREDAPVHHVVDQERIDARLTRFGLHVVLLGDRSSYKLRIARSAAPGIGVVPDCACGELRALPALLAPLLLRPANPDAGVDRDGAIRKAENRVEVELGHRGQVLAERREPVDEVDERGRVGRLGAAEAADESPGLAGRDELLGVDVGQGRDPEARFADQLGEHAARAERDERAEDRILQEPGEQLGTAAEHRLHDDGESDPLGGRADGRLVLEVERDAAGLGLVSARGGRLDDGWKAELGGRLGPRPSASSAIRSGTSGRP